MTPSRFFSWSGSFASSPSHFFSWSCSFASSGTAISDMSPAHPLGPSDLGSSFALLLQFRFAILFFRILLMFRRDGVCQAGGWAEACYLSTHRGDLAELKTLLLDATFGPDNLREVPAEISVVEPSHSL